MFRVKLDSGIQVLATPTRSASQVWTKFITGDRVEVELSPYDPSRGRITARISG
jgi:translation initiation factor IF-1